MSTSSPNTAPKGDPTPALSPEREQEIRERAAAATPGPWTANDPAGVLADAACQPLAVFGGGGQDHADAEFIAHARQDVPALLAEIDRLRGELRDPRTTALRDALSRLRRLRAMYPIDSPEEWKRRHGCGLTDAVLLVEAMARAAEAGEELLPVPTDRVDTAGGAR